VSHDDLSARALAELEALDAILAREPVAEEHLELAALVDSVRGGAPKMSAAFSAELAQRFEGPRRRRAGARGRAGVVHRGGAWALGSGGFVAAAVALTILVSGGVRHDLFGGGATTPARVLPPSGIVETPLPSAHSEIRRGASAGGVNAGHAAPLAASALPAFGPSSGRLVVRGSSLTLATPPSQISSLASEIVSATEAQGGVVEHSSVNVDGGASSNASFTLSVPSGRLGRLIAALSALAGVRSLQQSTQDITSPYRSETSLLARRQAQLRSLRAQLAVAATDAAAASLRRQIREVSYRISVERATIARLSAQASNATLSVTVVAGAAKKHHAVAPGALTRGFHDALHALQDILAIALIVLAILLPFALCGLVLWWAAWGVRQRARERAMRAA
jgi:Domain of unknown function (DUF4349)